MPMPPSPSSAVTRASTCDVASVTFDVGFYTRDALRARKVYDVNWLMRKAHLDPGEQRQHGKVAVQRPDLEPLLGGIPAVECRVSMAGASQLISRKQLNGRNDFGLDGVELGSGRLEVADLRKISVHLETGHRALLCERNPRFAREQGPHKIDLPAHMRCIAGYEMRGAGGGKFDLSGCHIGLVERELDLGEAEAVETNFGKPEHVAAVGLRKSLSLHNCSAGIGFRGKRLALIQFEPRKLECSVGHLVLNPRARGGVRHGLEYIKTRVLRVDRASEISHRLESLGDPTIGLGEIVCSCGTFGEDLGQRVARCGERLQCIGRSTTVELDDAEVLVGIGRFQLPIGVSSVDLR